MDVALGIGDDDVVLPEQEPEPVEDLGLDASDAELGIGDPHQYLVIDRAFAEGAEPDPGLGLTEDPR